MAKVSVIVPVYNVEKYLRKCVDSILHQTFTDLEVILVDDGSTDNSGIICDEYKEKDIRIQVVHKENGGQSDARNVGIRLATSDYVIFIDSDDYMKENMIEKLYDFVSVYKVDMSVCGVYNVYASGAKPQCGTLEEFRCDNEQAFAYILIGQKIPGTLCNKLILREIVANLVFPLGKIYEDAFYTTDLMQKVKSVYVTTEPMYYYFHRAGSTTTTPFRERDMNIIEAYQRNYQVVKDKFPQIEEQAKFRLDWAYFTVLDRILLLENYREIKEFAEVVAYLKKNVFSVLKSKYFYKSRKIGALAFLMNVKLYRILVKYNNRKNTKVL